MKTKNLTPSIAHKVAFWLSLSTSIVLFIAGFLVPPMGVIDGSVLQAAGILLGFSTVGMLPEIIQSGRAAKFSLPGGNSIELKAEEKNSNKSSDKSTDEEL